MMHSDWFLETVSLEIYTKASCPQEKCVPLQMHRNTSLVINSNGKRRDVASICPISLETLLMLCRCFGEDNTSLSQEIML